MNIYKKWLPVLKKVPEANRPSYAEELEREYNKALIKDPNTGAIMIFIKQTFPKIKKKHSGDTYVSPFTGDVL